MASLIRLFAAHLMLGALSWCAMGAAGAATPVFVLHSYSQEYPWTRGQNEGFIDTLTAPDSGFEAVVSTEYLDTKRRQYDPAYAQAFADHLRIKYAGYHPAAIYVSDDNALLFASTHLRQIFADVPVFFSGINDYNMHKTLDPGTYTGVFEKKEVRPNLEWLLRFDPGLREIVFVGDGSNTYAAIAERAKQDLASFPQIQARFIGEKQLDVMLAKLREQPPQYVILTTLGGMTDAAGKVHPLAHTLRALTEAVPRVVSMEDGYVREGVLGGYVTSGPLQGSGAARLMLKHLQGSPVAQVPALLNSPNAYLFDDAVLEKQGLELPAEIAVRATLLNPRQSFIDMHRVFIVSTLYALIAALFLVILAALFIVSRKNRELSLAQREAELANKAKSQFLANMSHEIRTPLTSVIGYAELLLDEDLEAAARRDALPSIIRNGHHLLDLINNVLDLAKIESGSFVPEKLRISTPHLLDELGELISIRAKAKGVRFEVVPEMPIPATFVSDPMRLKQILINFLSNAVKFTEHGEVRLELRYSAEPPVLCFSVTDTGIGMTSEEIERLFQPFVQADISTTRRFGGTGLGLHLCRQLAELLGARVEVESRPGSGSRFSLYLPLEAAPAKMLEQASALRRKESQSADGEQLQAQSLRGHVLLAEDGPDNQRLISAYLRRAGLEVTVVNNGREAVETAISEDFDLILMDIQMPEMDGVTATETLRAVGYTRPIVALTANVMKSEVQHYRDIGCNEVLSKPIERARFYGVLGQLLETVPNGGIDRETFARDFAELAEEFRRGLPAQLETMDVAFADQDWAGMRAQAHMLKGTAGSFGYPEITRLASQLEASIIAERHEDAIKLWRALRASTQAESEPKELA